MNAVDAECGGLNPDSTAHNGISSLHVGKYFPPFQGGMENFLADLLDALARRGAAGGAVVHDHVSWWRGAVQRVPVTRVHRDGDAPGDTSIRLYRVPSMGRLLYAPVSPRFPFWLARAIDRERPEVLHLHLPNPSAFWTLFLRDARRLPWVIHWHADVVASEADRRMKVAYPAYAVLERRLLDKARRVIVTSPDYLGGSRALRPWRDKCVVVPLGLSPSRIPKPSERARREAEGYWGDAGFRILSVGRLTYYKGHEYLVKALANLPGVRAVIVGEGARRGVVAREIDRLGLGGRAALTGTLSNELMHALMASCDCFCLPSIERTEAFGVVLIEAMAHGKATVVCDIPGSGVGWVVRDGETGRVVPAADPAALEDAFRRLSADRAGLARMGEAGRRRYRSHFVIDRVADQVLQVYEEVRKMPAPTH